MELDKAIGAVEKFFFRSDRECVAGIGFSGIVRLYN